MNFNNLLKSIFDYDPDGPNIHHLMAVHEYSVLIAQMENVDEHTLLIITSNAPDTYYENLIKNYQQTFNAFVGPTEVFVSGDTLQLKDYSKTVWVVIENRF